MYRVNGRTLSAVEQRDLGIQVQNSLKVTSQVDRVGKSAFHRILQCRKRPFGPSSLHQPQSHLGPIPISLHIYPLIPLTYASRDTKGQFRMANQPNLHIFGLWEETGAPGGNPRRHRENVQTPHSDPSQDSNPGPWSCEAAVLTTVLPCRPRLTDL